MMTIFLYLIITLQCSRHSTLGKNTKQTFILLLVPRRSSCSKYATRGTRGLKQKTLQLHIYYFNIHQGPDGSMSQVVGLSNNSYKPITNTSWVRACLCKLQKKGALDSHPQVIKFTSCLPMVGSSLRVLRLLPPLKLVAMILLKVALNTKNQSINIHQLVRQKGEVTFDLKCALYGYEKTTRIISIIVNVNYFTGKVRPFLSCLSLVLLFF